MFVGTVERKDIPEELAYRKSRLINFICISHLLSMKQVSNFCDNSIDPQSGKLLNWQICLNNIPEK